MNICSIYTTFRAWHHDEVEPTRAQLRAVFIELDRRIDELNRERRREGGFPLSKAEIQLLGQMSLLANQRVSALLSLAQTADLDALLKMEHLVKEVLKELLSKRGLLYDEDSYLIWIPDGARFEAVFNLKNVLVTAIDPESAHVSKAVKAPAKNKQLIREAIVSGEFPRLVERIEKAGGDLEFFAED